MIPGGPQVGMAASEMTRMQPTFPLAFSVCLLIGADAIYILPR